jgi:hypothetical protein
VVTETTEHRRPEVGVGRTCYNGKRVSHCAPYVLGRSLCEDSMQRVSALRVSIVRVLYLWCACGRTACSVDRAPNRRGSAIM